MLLPLICFFAGGAAALIGFVVGYVVATAQARRQLEP